MNHARTEKEPSDELPQAQVRRRRMKFPFVWIVPLVAAGVAGFLIYERAREFGPKLTIRFKDANGLRVGQTPLLYRGVAIGEVRAVELSPDEQFAVVTVRLKRSAGSIAREQSQFWIVRPQVGLGSITGLGTLLAGPHLEVLPGGGAKRTEYLGLDTSPVAQDGGGLNLVLVSSHLGALKHGSPVYYRGVEVGAIQDVQLSSNTASVEIQVLIQERYRHLVQSSSKFWNVSGMDVKVGLFRGAEISLESLRSLVTGGVAFATPEDPKAVTVNDGARFQLFDEAKKEWLEWAPERALEAK